MTLGELLNKIPDDMIVSIGAKEAYFFIGKKCLFDADKMDKLCTDRLKQLIRRNRCQLKVLKLTPPVREENEPQKDFEGRVVLWKRAQEVKSKTIQNRKKQLAEASEKIKDREVLNVFRRVAAPGIAIVIAGDTHGQYWFLSEAEKERSKGSDDKGKMDPRSKSHGNQQRERIDRAGCGRHT